MNAAELVLRDLLDSAVQEDVAGLGSARRGAAPAGLPAQVVDDARWVTITLGPGGRLAWRAHDGAPWQGTRHAGGPAWHLPADAAPRPVGAAEVLTLLTTGDAAAIHTDVVAADLRTAVEHARTTATGFDRLPADAIAPRRGEAAAALLAGERLAATRGRPFHPTARAAVGWSAADLDRWGPMAREPVTPAWVLVRRDHLRHGPGADSMALHRLVLGHPTLVDAGIDLDLYQPLPVHPSDRDRVLPEAFADEIAAGIVVPLDRRPAPWTAVGALWPTASLRTLQIPALRIPAGRGPAHQDRVRHLKLPLDVATLGATRLLPPRYLDNADRARRTLDAVLAADPALANAVAPCDEDVWAGFAAPDGADELALRPGRLAAQIRTYPDLGALPLPLATPAADVWDVLGPVLGVDGFADARRYVLALARLVLGVAVGFLGHGVLPEMHGQNVVVVHSPAGDPERLVLRDHDTVRVHRGWARAAGTPDPAYRIAPGASQSLVLDRPEDLVAYLQTLVVQVALRGVGDALGRHLGVAEAVWWPVLGEALVDAVDRSTDPVQSVLRATLVDAPTWPARSVLGPLLRAGASGGVSMPAGTVRIPNPFRRRTR